MSGHVLITGATGFIGGMLAARLAVDGYGVRCLVRGAAGSRAQALEQAGLELHVGDVLRPETLRGAGRGIDATTSSTQWDGEAPGISRRGSARRPQALLGWLGTRGSSGSSTWVG